MGIKEGADVMKGKEFVCHFCVSSIMMKMREEIASMLHNYIHMIH